MKRFLTLILSFMAGLVLYAHPIKMTTGKVSYNPENGNLEILMNFFMDDFSAHLQDIYHFSGDDFINSPREYKDYVADYVFKKFNISLNYQKKELHYTSMQVIEDNVLQVKLSVENVKGLHINTLEIRNEVLLEAFTDQANLMHVKMNEGDKVQMFRFTKGNSKKVFKLDSICD